MPVTEKTLFLHIGLPKTATTWLQERIFPCLDHIEVRPVPKTRLFLAPDDAAAEFRVFACAMRRSANVWAVRGEEIFGELLGDKDSWSREARDLLVSDEAIGRAASRPELLAAHLREFFRIAAAWSFERMKIAMVVRRQDTWLASHFAQISDRNPLAGQARFERGVRQTIDPMRGRYGFGMLLDYAALHMALEEAVGSEHVLALSYESFEEAPQEALGRLLNWLRTPRAQAEALARRAIERANARSKDGPGGRIWRLRSPSIALPGRGRRVRLPATLWPPRHLRMTAALSDEILASYEQTNRAFAEHADLDLARHGYF